MRERHISPGSLRVQPGITPARAGKTSWASSRRNSGEDHPRSCGKDKKPHFIRVSRPGSPPLVRERRQVGFRGRRDGGITPARAGKTPYFRRSSRSSQDHPRSCGKDLPCEAPAMARTGSPPLVRERQSRRRLPANSVGITPARAGKTYFRGIA